MNLLGRREVFIQALDPRGQPWLLEADDLSAVLCRFPPRRYPPDNNRLPGSEAAGDPERH